jgi:hypothetical protein
VEVFVGKRERLPVRLIAVRVSPEEAKRRREGANGRITHWELLLGCWQAPNRSLLKAKQVVQWMTPCLALALTGLVPVQTIVERTALMMQTGCTINSRRKRPNTHQLLADPRLVRALG